jgi:S-DNA-T family DNA segregation ATPase FtsK/SpoIIIE
MSAISNGSSSHPFGQFAGLCIFTAGALLGVSLWSADITLAPDASTACWTGRAGWYAAFFSRISFGTLPALVLALLVTAWGAWLARGRAVLPTWPQVVGGLVMVTALSILAVCVTGAQRNPLYGGLVGLQLGGPALPWLGTAGLFGTGLLGLILGAGLTFGRHLAIFFRACASTCESMGRLLIRGAAALASAATALLVAAGARCARWREARAARRDANAGAVADLDEGEGAEPSEELPQKEGDEEEPATEPEPDEALEPVAVEEAKPKPRKRARPRQQASVTRDRVLVRPNEEYELPPVDLLERIDDSDGEAARTIEKRADILEKTLAEFKIDGRVVGTESGPRVTMFEVSLAPGIRVERIFQLANNITMALKAHNVRIVAPIPGKDTVGIEIPNMDNKMVHMREIIDDYDLEKNAFSAPMFLGADITGAAIIGDLAKMPHLLIAGATGSGKSVCINAILLSFLMARRPDELKLILIDPKMVELSRFKNVPHLMCPVVTDMKRAAGILEWACAQMDQRYEQLAQVGVNNIAKFNALGEEEIVRRLVKELPEEELEVFPKRMPYMVIVVDELADLMLVAGKEVEKSIIRLASKSRAVGIHVILATQRPSVDVITGLIKANMPSRIAFQVASKVDSRTILDTNGAENLLGAGDMLYMPPASSKLVRSQGVFVTDNELFAVVEHCRDQATPDFHEELDGPVVGGAAPAEDADRDELFDEAVRAILENQRGSVSLLQRKLGIGYGRASRMIDQIAEAGILGPFREGKAREIMMTLEEYEAAFYDNPATTGAPASAAAAYEQAGEEDDDDEDFESYDGDSYAGARDDERGPAIDLPWDE